MVDGARHDVSAGMPLLTVTVGPHFLRGVNATEEGPCLPGIRADVAKRHGSRQELACEGRQVNGGRGAQWMLGVGPPGYLYSRTPRLPPKEKPCGLRSSICGLVLMPGVFWRGDNPQRVYDRVNLRPRNILQHNENDWNRKDGDLYQRFWASYGGATPVAKTLRGLSGWLTIEGGFLPSLHAAMSCPMN